MYALNDHLGKAQRRLRYAASAEVNASHPNAPAQYHNTWQHLLEERPRLPHTLPSTPRHSIPSRSYGFTGSVNEAGYPSESWEDGGNYLLRGHRHSISTLRNNGLVGLPSRLPSESSSIPRQIHPSLDYLPNAREILAPGPNIINTGSSTLWNTDGTGGDQDWMEYSLPDRTFHDLDPSPWNQPPVSGYEPSLNYAVAHRTLYPLARVTYNEPSFEPYLSRRASLMASSPAPIDRGASQLPVSQQWRTDNLAASAQTRRKNDSLSRHKQEAYRQKAEARRHTIAAGVPQPQVQTNRPLPTRGPPITKAALPAKRAPGPLPTPGPPRAKAAPTKRRENGPAPGASKPKRHKARPASTSAAQAKSFTKAVPADATPVSPSPEDPEIEIIPPPPTFDELPQPIVCDYEDYKWSVYHYELQPISGFAFAESWLHELFNTTLRDSYTTHHVSHASRGFIADGTRLSMLVLHNAADPFITSHPPSNTITIGVYGYHWHTHSTIHWTTLSGDHRHLITQCLAANFLSEKRRWSANSPRAAETRFHRAYWLAANQRDVKDLLNRSESADKPHELIEDGSADDPDPEWKLRRRDLAGEWDVSEAQAQAAWEEVERCVKALGEVWGERGHVVVSSTEGDVWGAV